MATNTTNYSFKKPDESDFYDVQDQNGNWDMADEALKSLDTPTFEDYTGSTPVPAANTAIDGIKSKTKLSALMSNIKAAFKGACLIGHIVNNCVTNNPNLPLSAAQGKVLMDLYTRLNGEAIKCMFGISDRDLNNATHPGIYLVDFGASSVKNGPDTGEYFTGALFIINSGNFLIQLFFDGNQYFRKRFYNSWTAWIKTTRDL